MPRNAPKCFEHLLGWCGIASQCFELLRNDTKPFPDPHTCGSPHTCVFRNTSSCNLIEMSRKAPKGCWGMLDLRQNTPKCLETMSWSTHMCLYTHMCLPNTCVFPNTCGKGRKLSLLTRCLRKTHVCPTTHTHAFNAAQMAQFPSKIRMRT